MNQKEKNYKETLLMPKTSFEMRGNLPQKDKYFIRFWENKINYYSDLNDTDFILHDGPPYANGDLHLGHAVNKILKDIVVRHNLFLGRKVHWKLGWDTHGLPIETAIQKQGINLANASYQEYMNACYNFALSQVKKQELQFKKFGLYTNFNDKYLTLKKEYVVKELEIFYTMLNKGFVYQDFKPVYWSWSSNTALADAEIEYTDILEKAIFVSFKLNSKKKFDKNYNNLKFLIWTTTPWTLPANVAVAFGKDIKYVVCSYKQEKFVIAKDLVSKLSELLKINLKVEHEIDLNNFIGENLINPINNNNSKILIGSHVTTKDGTGLVHIAGGHGIDDYKIVLENKLKIIVCLNEKGIMINSGEFNDLFYKEANQKIIEKLQKNNALIFVEDITHSVPIDWRTKKPIVYRATKQWFVSISKIKKDLINIIDDVNWYPSWGSERLKKMISSRDDWCISRQRKWGVPIPVIYDEKGKPIISEKLQEKILEFFRLNNKAEWQTVDIKKLLPSDIKYDPKMKKELDILDVWFDSGSSHNYLLGKRIANLYLEGNDQYRGWFNSSLITSYIQNNQAPYKNVFTHGFVVDDNNNKMSKSLQNGINPITIADKYGLDILRLWVASSDYFSNIKITSKILEQVSGDYLKIRNTIRFLLGNLNDIPKSLSYSKGSIISEMMLEELKNSQIKMNHNAKEFKFYSKIKEVVKQINTGSVAYYLDYVKDIVYIEAKDSPKRREAQYVLKQILDFILYNLAIIIPVTIEEAYQIFNKSEEITIFQTKYPNVFLNLEKQENEDDISLWKKFNKLKNTVNKAIESLRLKKILNRSQEADVILTIPEEFKIFETIDLKDFLMIGNLTIKKGNELKATATKFNLGIKCMRCWRLFNKSEMRGDICINCKKTLSTFSK